MMKTFSLLAAVLLFCCSATINASDLARDKVVAEVQRLGGTVEFDEAKKDRLSSKLTYTEPKSPMQTSSY